MSYDRSHILINTNVDEYKNVSKFVALLSIQK